MNRGVLSNLVALGEGFTTEFKRAGTSGLGREICAFANATGGMILIGVADDGRVCGVADHNRLKSEVLSIARSAGPPIAVEIESVGKVLCVRVPAQQSKPYSFGGKFYIREGSSSQQMLREEIREFFYKEGLIHFDETACDKFSLERDWTAPGLLDTRVRVFDLMRPPQLERVFPALPGPAFGSRSPRESNDGYTGS